MFFKTLIGIMIPFIGTSTGSAGVFIVKKSKSNVLKSILSALAGGIMFAASIWSLIIPSIEYRNNSVFSIFETSSALLIGFIFMIYSEHVIEKLSQKKISGNFDKNTLLQFFAVTVHNIPEGLAVGLVFASYLIEKNRADFISALILSIGIALQNIPEGAIISMPLYANGMKKSKAFIFGILSGIVEPISSIISVLAFSYVEVFLPFMLSFAAGAMIFVVIKQLIPEMYSVNDKTDNIAVIFFGIGFLIMMSLDVLLG